MPHSDRRLSCSLRWFVISRWLETANPPIPHRGLVGGRVGFDTGGYLAIAIGLTFVFLGNKLPKGYYLF